jgi:DNA-binding transcriptional ArsR family regulator
VQIISPRPVSVDALTCRVPDLEVLDLLSFLVRRPASAYRAASALGLSLSTAYAKAARARQHGLVEARGRSLHITTRGLIYCLCKNCEEKRLVLERLMQRFEIKTDPAYVEAYVYLLLKALESLSMPLEEAPVEKLCSSATLVLAVLRRAPLGELPKFLQLDWGIYSAALPVLAEGLARLGLAMDLGTHYYFPAFGLVVCKTPCSGHCTIHAELKAAKRKIRLNLRS